MTPRRFDWVLRSRGPALDSWPEAERDAALALLRHDDAARRALADALAVEDVVPASASERDALARMRRVVRHAIAPPAPVMRGLGVGAMAACVAAGLYLGTMESDAAAIGPDAAVPSTVLAALDP